MNKIGYFISFIIFIEILFIFFFNSEYLLTLLLSPLLFTIPILINQTKDKYVLLSSLNKNFIYSSIYLYLIHTFLNIVILELFYLNLFFTVIFNIYLHLHFYLETENKIFEEKRKEKFKSKRVFSEEERTFKTKKEAFNIFEEAERIKKSRENRDFYKETDNIKKEREFYKKKVIRDYDYELRFLSIECTIKDLTKTKLKKHFKLKAKLYHPDSSTLSLTDYELTEKMKELNSINAFLKQITKK